MSKAVLIGLVVLMASCTSIDSNSLKLEPGMSKADVVEILGLPDRRSFRGNDEALQYQGVVGYGQCVYITAWLSEGTLIASTERRGSSIAGCGLGSREVDWGQMPTPSIDINLNTKAKM